MSLNLGGDTVGSGASQIRATAFKTITANHVLLTDGTDRYIKADPTLGNIAIDLPAASGAAGAVYHITRIATNSNNVNINPDGTDNINGFNVSIPLKVVFDFVELMSDGTGWYILNQGDLTLGFSTVTASTTLIAAVQQNVYTDPTAADVILTLPTAVGIKDTKFFVKRIVNGNNVVKLTTTSSQTIDESTQDFILALKHEWVEVISDGANWEILSRNTSAAASMNSNSGGVQLLSGTPTILSVFDFDTFSTPQRILADQANDQISVENIQGDIADYYDIRINGTAQFTNNQTAMFQVYLDGSASPLTAIVEGEGAVSKPFSMIGFLTVLAPTVPQKVEIRVSSTSSTNLTIDPNCSITLTRLGG